MPEDQPEWHPEVLPADWMRAAESLTSRHALDEFYLAGGTGLALCFGHRRSIDLDLFRESEFDSSDVRNHLRGLAGLRNLETAPGTIHLQLHGVKVSFLHYPYPRLFPLRRFERIAVADPRDIACMKLDVIGNRGSRRDFIDLYIAARAFGLNEVLGWFAQKYASVSYSRTHLFKALTYFAEAEREPMPDMLLRLEWTAVRRYFLSEVPRLLHVD